MRFGYVCLLIAGFATLGLAGCSRSAGEVTDKVLADWGLKEYPEGYESRTDRVYDRLNVVGQTELERLQRENRDGEVKYEEEGLTGRYYKEQRRYDSYYPLDARVSNRSSRGTEGGYFGYIKYTYRIMQGPRFSNRTEAAASTADIPTGEEDSIVMRYKFTSGGAWDGGEGEVTNE